MIVVAMPDETKLLKDGQKDAVLITGAGADNIIKSLIGVPRDTPIINIGYAGSNLLPAGTVCRIGRVGFYHPVAGKLKGENTYLLDGNIPCYTSGDFVTKTDISDPCVFDMELAYILSMGFTNVSAEKVVSDNLSMEDFELCLKK